MKWIDVFNLVVMLLFQFCYLYQIFFLLVGLVKKPKTYAKVEQNKRYAVMVSARNEQRVIGQLCDSVREQDYPEQLLDIFVVADNCTDNTKQVAFEHGATVFERFDNEKKGKGYALEFLFDKVREFHGKDYYDGFFIIDADNLLAKDYVTQMDRCYQAGNEVITCYRNSKNYGDNWISAGYSLWFLREAKYLNHPRSLFKTGCAVSGTGFFVSKKVINRQGGWKHFLLTEDIEFSSDCALHGERIGYCHQAMVFDEQPTKFSQSWRQRSRWAKGFMQIMGKYGGSLLKGFFTGKGFACYDMLMTTAPAFVLSVVSIFVNLAAIVYSAVFYQAGVLAILRDLGNILLGACGLMFVVGVVTGITEWKNIHAPAWKKLLSFITFPFFMLTYIPIAVYALFFKVEWKPIEHKVSISLEEVAEEKKKKGKR